ncbi:GntR family transcriptional regulator [Pelagibius sp.]|uniref:GntR family transcriptional regulator n=1 Tax=Pelagibius sp. TaxID=1931238 RepID=UPI003B504159
MNDWQAPGGLQPFPSDFSNVPSTKKMRSVSRAPMHVAVAEQVRSLIIDGKLHEGERINENDLAEYLGCSRTPLRDALKVLQSEGLIRIEPHKGTFVSQITVAETEDRFEAMALIERVGGELTTRKITDDQLRWFAELHRQMFAFHDEGKQSEYSELNDRIHRSFVSLSGNKMLAATHENLIVAARRVRVAAIRASERWEESVAEHREILVAMEAREAERVGQLIEQHVRRTAAFVCAHLRESETKGPRPRRSRVYDRRPGFAG